MTCMCGTIIIAGEQTAQGRMVPGLTGQRDAEERVICDHENQPVGSSS